METSFQKADVLKHFSYTGGGMSLQLLRENLIHIEKKSYILSGTRL